MRAAPETNTKAEYIYVYIYMYISTYIHMYGITNKRVSERSEEDKIPAYADSLTPTCFSYMRADYAS